MDLVDLLGIEGFGERRHAVRYATAIHDAQEHLVLVGGELAQIRQHAAADRVDAVALRAVAVV
ncbi:hypothetical protein D3C81_2035640 [compost metagenome]